MPTSRFMVTAVLAAAVLLAGPAVASTVLELDVDALTERADRVVRARVIERESRWDDDGHMIRTFTTLEILANLKGEGEAHLVVRQLGGEVDDVGSFVTGDAHFEIGEEVLVFLRSNPDGEPVFHLIGLAQGKFRIERSPDGVRAVRDLSDLSLARQEGGRLVIGHAETVSTLDLDDLARTIREAADR
jgi:hypothetical protein